MIEVRSINNIAKLKHLPAVYYAPIVDGVELSCCSETYDMALLLGLAHKYDGINSQFPKMAARMLQINSIWADKNKG